MCGIAGFSGVSEHKRIALLMALGRGIDTRGGHARGYVGETAEGDVDSNRAVGPWKACSKRWYQRMAKLDTVTLHARWATHANAGKTYAAHPFPIRRGKGRSVLWGMHNGVVDASASAAEAGREYHVDSWEVFERIADGDTEALGRMPGYGTLAWFDRSSRGCAIVMASEDADLSVCETKCGAIVWASTDAILFGALKAAGMKCKSVYELEVGRVARILAGAIEYVDHPPVRFGERRFRTSWQDFGFDLGKDEEDDKNACDIKLDDWLRSYALTGTAE